MVNLELLARDVLPQVRGLISTEPCGVSDIGSRARTKYLIQYTAANSGSTKKGR